MNRRNAFARLTFAVVSIAGALACSTDDPGSPAAPPIDLTGEVTDAPSTGTVTGIVLNSMRAPVEGARILVGEAEAISGADGTFSLEAKTGRASLVASAAGYVTVTRTIGTTSMPTSSRIVLVAKADSVPVKSTGAQVSAGPVTLDVPSGAYPSGGKVSATWLPQRAVISASGRPLFIEGDALYRYVGQLHVEATAQPERTVRVRVPVPAGLTSEESIVLRQINGTEAMEVVEPATLENGFAVFELPHFSVWSVMRRRVIAGALYAGLPWVLTGWMILDAERAFVRKLGELRGGSPANVAEGDLLEPGTDLPAGSDVEGARVVAGAPNGTIVSFEGGMGLDTDEDYGAGARCLELCKNVVEEVPPAAPRKPGKLRAWLRTWRNAFGGMGVRGTVFSFTQESCSSKQGSSINRGEVSEGSGEFYLGSATLEVSQGKRARGCEGCANPKAAVCDCDVDACARARGQCLQCDETAETFILNDERGKPLVNCAPLGSMCCKHLTSSSLCTPNPKGFSICQCAGTDWAACASPNSGCGTLDNSDTPRVVDCGYDGTSPCNADGVGLGNSRGWRCVDFSRDVNHCGACNRHCDYYTEVCFEGECRKNAACAEGGVCYTARADGGGTISNSRCSPSGNSCQCFCCKGPNCDQDGQGTWRCNGCEGNP